MRSITNLLTGFAITISLTSIAHAELINFDLTDPDSRNGVYNSTYAKQYNYEEGNLGLAVTGWSYGKTNKIIEQEYVGKWDGLGVEKTDSPNHAIDNEKGDFDMLLLSFDEMVELLSIDLGWISGDSDVSLLAFNGSSFVNSLLLGKKWEDLIGNGWQSAGNYYNVDYGSNGGSVNQGGIVSQYWLVGAYNDKLGGFTGPNKNLSSGNDYFKIKGITVERPPVEVPEPGSLLLLALGMIGIGILRRRTA